MKKERASVDLCFPKRPRGSETAPRERRDEVVLQEWPDRVGGFEKGRRWECRGEDGRLRPDRGRREIAMRGGNCESRVEWQRGSGCRVTPEGGRCGC